MTERVLIIDLAESRECVQAAQEAMHPFLLKHPSAQLQILSAKSLLNRSGLLELLRTPWTGVVLATHSRVRTRLLPWFEAAISLSRSRALWIFEAQPGRLTSLSRLSAVLTSLLKITCDATLAPLFLFQSSVQLARLERTSRSSLPNSAPLLAATHWNILFMRCDAYVGAKSGGSVGHLAGVLNAMANQNHDVELFSSDHLEEVNYARVQLQEWKGDFPAWNIPVGGGAPFTDRAVTQLLLKDIEDRSSPLPRVIYHRYHIGTLGAVRLRNLLRIPLILEFNGSEVWAKINWGHGKGVFDTFFGRLENLALHAADAIVVVSDVLRDQLIERGYPAHKIISVPNGVDTSKFDPARLEAERAHIRSQLNWENQRVIGFVGTFGKWHGTKVLAQSINRIAETDGLLRFLIVGDGLLKAEFEAALTPKARRITHMTGRTAQEKTPGYLAACDAYVSPHVPNPDGSRFFGSPTKLFEYMAMAKPIFASSLEQLAEIIEDGVSGKLLPPGDPDALTQILQDFAKNPREFEPMGANARQRVQQKYTWDAHWTTIENRFREILSASSSP